MPSTNMTVAVLLRYQRWRMRLGMVLVRLHLVRLAAWVLDGLRFDVKVANRDWKEHGRLKVTTNA